MPGYSKNVLSGSTIGRQIGIATTATPGTYIHSVAPPNIDEVWLYAFNRSASSTQLTVEWGGSDNTDDRFNIALPVSGSGLTLVIPGFVLTGGTVRVFASVSGSVFISGYVNRIS